MYDNKISFVLRHLNTNFLEQERCKLDKLLWDNKNKIMQTCIEPKTSDYHIKDE